MIATDRGIRCAHCKDYHASIDEVKTCAKIEQALKVFDHVEKVPPARPAHITLRQIAKREAVPAGRYAIYEQAVLKFYRVSKPTEGRWSGRIFVERQLGDDLIPLKTHATKNAVLDQIAQNPQEAMLRYGREIGTCGHCGRTLTNEDSRALGIGPVCRGRMGW